MTIIIVFHHYIQMFFLQFDVTDVTFKPIALKYRKLRRDSKPFFAVICCHCCHATNLARLYKLCLLKLEQLKEGDYCSSCIKLIVSIFLVYKVKKCLI